MPAATAKEPIPIAKPAPKKIIDEDDDTEPAEPKEIKKTGKATTKKAKVDDDENELKKTIHGNIEKVDILVLTGGISVGDYDFAKPVLEELGVQESFYKVKQKPGKPFFFGTFKNTEIFALPGNPSAVVTCYHAYLKPFINAKMGDERFDKKESGILMTNYTKKTGLTHFVKAFVENNKVEILPNQLSYQMDAYAKANAFAILPENRDHFQIGEKVDIIKF